MFEDEEILPFSGVWDEGFEDEEELWEYDDSCSHCGPWCPEWGGDGLCNLALRVLAEEYWRESHPFLLWLEVRREELRWMLWRLRRWVVLRCPDCGEPEQVFGRATGDHSDCCPF